MKKMHKLFSVLLALAMLLTSTVALAEEATTLTLYSINLSDVTMSMDDETVMDLSGMTIKLGAGVSGAGSEALVRATVLGGDDTAAEANVALADNKVAINVDGMSAPLTLDLAELLTEENINMLLEALMAQFSEDELAGLTKIYGAVTELCSEEGMNTLSAGYETYLTEVETLLTDVMTMSEGVSNSFIVGPDEEISSTMITIAMDGDTVYSLMEAAVKMYDSQPAIIDLINGILLLDGGDVQITSYSEMLDMEGLRAELEDVLVDVYVYVSDEYDNGYIDVVVSMSEDGEEELSMAFGIGVVDSIRMVMLASDAYGDEVYADFSMCESEEYAGEIETSFYMSASEDGEEEELLNLWIGPDPDYGTLGVMTIGAEDDAVGFAWGYSDSLVVLNIYDNYGTSMEIGFAITGDTTGELYFVMEEYDTTYEISATVGVSEEEVSLDEVSTLANTAGTNLMTITDEQIEALTGELQNVLISGAMILMNNVPGLATMIMGE